ncbi:MAG: hypothetical protein JWO31_2961 [Phycisphaerales bacterium]|nr:hypothetical protein [Phycisphaerales bacterium]
MTPFPLLQARSVPLDQILKAALVLVGVVVVGLVIVSQIRKRLNEAEDPSKAAGGFMLSDLRQLHREGQITDEEFEKAKAKVIDAAKRAAARDAAKADPPRRDTPAGEA